jgi:general secretion pathway protein H
MTGRGTRGFTLIELTVTLVILGIAAAVAAPSLAQSLDAMRARSEAAGIATFLRAAREQAVTHNRAYEVTVRSEEGVVELRTGESGPAVPATTRRLATGVRVTAEPGTARVIIFLPQGLSSGARLRVEGPGRRAYLITVEPLTGRVATQRLET